MSWTQGVEGLNLKKKASRKRRNMDLANKEKSLEEELRALEEMRQDEERKE